MPDGVFTSIVAGTDGSQTARTALRAAADLARQSNARLVIVSAYEPLDSGRSHAEGVEVPADRQWAVAPRSDVLELLEESRRLAVSGGVAEVETVARQGDAADAIIDVAEEQHADLIVIGNKGMTGAKRFLLGSVPNRVSHHAPCSVLIVRTT